MTDLLERAMTTAWTLPPGAQDEIARVVLKMAIDEEVRAVCAEYGV